MSYLIQGRSVSMPCLVRDASSGVAIFQVSAELARRLLPGDSLDVVEIMPGEAQLVLGFVDYRDNDLGDYNEVMIVLLVRPRSGEGPDGTYIYKLPVNQSFTQEAGSKIWGFPKTIERIDVEYADDHARCRLYMDEQLVFDLRVPRAAMDEAAQPDLEMTTYTFLDATLHAVPFTSGGKGTAMTMGNEGVELALGSHPLADELRRLGLPKPALMSTWTEHMTGSFGAPRRLGAGSGD